MNFFFDFLGNFWGNLLGISLEDFFGGIYFEEFLGRNLFGGFILGGLFLGGFFCRNSLEGITK